MKANKKLNSALIQYRLELGDNPHVQDMIEINYQRGKRDGLREAYAECRELIASFSQLSAEQTEYLLQEIEQMGE